MALFAYMAAARPLSPLKPERLGRVRGIAGTEVLCSGTPGPVSVQQHSQPLSTGILTRDVTGAAPKG
ncbi:hypothetical protein Q5P01_024280 [Channa striata]|uniref:Uncharacterized protein n=1 Tax=Channa striata TaxID=64152 RepID=A0AA88ITE2_CHASR|nr:hypothetical protein Q5P01_024280 [Channa striata]